MRKFVAVVAAVVLLGLSGCASLLPQQAKSQIVSGVTKYCTGVSPMQRSIFRSDVNALLAGVAEVKVTCAGDDVAPAQ